MIEGYGHTIDVILISGDLNVGDTIVINTFNGPITTKIRALLTPPPMKEIRVKAEYQHNDHLTGVMGIKICAPNLEHVVAGTEIKKSEDLCDA